jgi:opacity protein-like surface antigen
LKLLPHAGVSPFVSVGGGYAQFEQSTTLLDGSTNTGPRRIHRGAFSVAGGLDIGVFSWLRLRGEVRHYRTGSPAFAVPVSGAQNNLLFAGGFALRF